MSNQSGNPLFQGMKQTGAVPVIYDAQGNPITAAQMQSWLGNTSGGTQGGYKPPVIPPYTLPQGIPQFNGYTPQTFNPQIPQGHWMNAMQPLNANVQAQMAALAQQGSK